MAGFGTCGHKVEFVVRVKRLLQLKQNNVKQMQNIFVLDLFQRFLHVKQKAETRQK